MSKIVRKSWLVTGSAVLAGAVLAAGISGGGSGLVSTAMAQADLSHLTMPFKEWRLKWQRKADTGNLGSDFEVKELKVYEGGGEPVIEPKPGDLYVYVNTGGQNWGVPTRPNEINTNKFSRVNVIDAKTKMFLGSGEMRDMDGRSHTSAISPDGRFAYVPAGRNQPVMFKVDALTLEPLKMLDVGARIHHINLFRDRYMMIDSFSMSEWTGYTKRATMLFDPETDKIIGGISSDRMGGNQYTAWVGPKEEFIYFLMEPFEGGFGSGQFVQGQLGGGAPYWVAKVDPDNWEVVKEYPYPGYRSDWIQFSGDGTAMYVNGAIEDSVMKLDLATGDLVWRQPTGSGPYAIEDAGNGEIWVADKGESWKRHRGRTISVYDAENGSFIDTIVHDGRGTDHLTLSPDGKEIWATANDSGTVFVIDVETHAVTAEIPMPQWGDPHGVVFVHYDENGKGRVVADQADFHGGIDPRNGKPLM